MCTAFFFYLFFKLVFVWRWSWIFFVAHCCIANSVLWTPIQKVKDGNMYKTKQKNSLQRKIKQNPNGKSVKTLLFTHFRKFGSLFYGCQVFFSSNFFCCRFFSFAMYIFILLPIFILKYILPIQLNWNATKLT